MGDAGVALFWLLARQAEEAGRKDELACRARGQTDFCLSASPQATASINEVMSQCAITQRASGPLSKHQEHLIRQQVWLFALQRQPGLAHQLQ